jgi:predicted GH43/DUF377 family glycosyl hydrolase
MIFHFITALLAAKGAVLDPLLEETLSPIGIVQTKQIEIPGFPKAFNPSLIPYQDGYLLSFRTTHKHPIKNSPRVDASYIGIAKLDAQFNVLKNSAQLLFILSYGENASITAEDARLFKIDDRIFILFNDLPVNLVHRGHMLYWGEIIEYQGRFLLKEPTKPLYYADARHMEKNWSPFLFNGKIHFIYSDTPRIILEMDSDTGICSEVVRFQDSLPTHWQWGHVRGGTPAYPLEGQMITFFHSSIRAETTKEREIPRQGLNYVMGAYTFDPYPPFSIRSITPAPLGTLEDYESNNYRKVVFPGGLVIDDPYIHVAWGKNDNQAFITTFDQKQLLQFLQPSRLTNFQ